jgi:NAD(P)-dependent dehydrogenase (short-subunit alcohol dehydrogenase family)
MTHSAFNPSNVAVVAGGASGIGFAAAKRFAALKMKICIADMPGARLEEAAAELAKLTVNGAADVLAEPADVSRLDQVERLHDVVLQRFGAVHVLMNNAGIQPGSDIFGPTDLWRRILDVNLYGIINGTQVFTPQMIAGGQPGLIINTGSKQGITTPPGDPAYNVSKAAVKAFTEALQHSLRNCAGCKITSHLLIPGFVFTPLTAKGRTQKPAAAWTPEETIDFMMRRLDAGDFYILCPDNDASRELDQRRMLWAMGDIVENRPPLSRWHPDYEAQFKAFVASSV